MPVDIKDALRRIQEDVGTQREQGTQPPNVQAGQYPEPAQPSNVSKADYGKPYFYDLGRQRLVADLPPEALTDRYAAQAYVPVYYDPFMDAVTSQKTPIRMRVGMDPNNLDDSLLEAAEDWSAKERESWQQRRNAQRGRSMNAVWRNHERKRQFEKRQEADATMRRLIEVNDELSTTFVLGVADIKAPEDLGRRQRLLDERKELKEKLREDPILFSYMGMDGKESNLELTSPEAKVFGYQLVWGAQRGAMWWKTEVAGREEASGHSAVPFASDLAWSLARFGIAGLKPILSLAFAPFSIRTRELNKDIFTAYMRNDPGGLEHGEGLAGSVKRTFLRGKSFFLSRGSMMFTYAKEDLDIFDQSLDQAAASYEEMLVQISSGENIIGGGFSTMDDLKLDQFRMQLETGQVQYGGSQQAADNLIKNIVLEQGRRSANLYNKVTSESKIQEAIEAINFADANELDMTEEEYNEIFAKSYIQIREGLDFYIRRSDIPAYWFTYSQRLIQGGEEFQEKQLDAIAQFIMTAHRMPEPWEWEEINNRFTDPAAEFVGEMVFDPINLIPGFVFDEIVDVAKATTRLGASAAKQGAWWGIKHVPPLEASVKSVARWYGDLSVRSMATTTRFWLLSPLQQFANRHKDWGELTKLVDDALNQVVSPSRGISNKNISDLRKVMDAMGWADPGLAKENISQMITAARKAAAESRYSLINGDMKAKKALAEQLGKAVDDLTQQEMRIAAEGWASNWHNVSSYLGDIIEQTYLKSKQIDRFFMDEGIIAFFKKRGGAGENIIDTLPTEALLRSWRTIMTAWKGAILTLRPGFTVINYLDSMMRAAVNGVDPLVPFHKAMLGRFTKFIPEEILQRFAGPELPGIGKVPEAILRGDIGANLPGLFKRGFQASEGGLPGIKKVADGFRALNVGFEFTLSSRLWQKEFAQNMSLIEGLTALRRAAMTDGMDEVSAAVVRELAQQAGDDSVETVLQRFLKGEGRFVVPQRLYDDLGEMVTSTEAKWYWENVARDAQDLVKAGLEGDDLKRGINKVLDDRMEEMHADYELALQNMNIMTNGGSRSIDETNVMDSFDVSKLSDEEAAVITAKSKKVIEEVAESSGRDPSAFRVDEDNQVLEDLRRALSDLGGDANNIKLLDSRNSRSGQALAAARARMKDLSAEFELEVASLNMRAQVLAVGGPSAQATRVEVAAQLKRASQKLEYVNSYESMMNQLYSGPIREFSISRWPGPMNPYFGTKYRAALWNRYFKTREQIFDETVIMFETAMANARNPAFDLTDLPNIEETLRRWGFDMQYGTKGELIGLRTGKIHPDTGRFIVIESLPTDPNMMFDFSHGALRFDPNVHQSGFQDFVQQPFERGMIQGRPPLRTKYSTEWANANEKAWWDDLIDPNRVSLPDETYNMLQQLGKRYRGVRNARGELVLQDFNALKMHILEEARIADDLGRPASARVLRYRHRALVDEYNAAHHMAEPGVAPTMPHAGIPEDVPAGMRTWIEVGDDGENRLALLDRLHDELKDDIANRIDNGGWEFKLTKEQRLNVKAAADELQALQEEAVRISNYGGEFMGHNFGDGAVGTVNRAMIDYARETNPERFIKKIFPFWKFPSKSLPFWTETMARNPEIMAFYAKYIQLSRRHAYNLGAVNSKGQQLPRLEGYLPFPGSPSKWWNPLAPFSFRYVIPRTTPRYGDNDDDDNIPPGVQVASFLYEYGTMFGFNPNPMVTIGLSMAGTLDETKFPKWSLIPQTGLIPPFFQRYIGQALRKYAAPNMPDLWLPELPWQNSLIEKQVLIFALEEMSNPDLTFNQRNEIALLAEATIMHRNLSTKDEDGNTLYENAQAAEKWHASRNHIENQEYYSRTLGYFTGVYPKEFSDAEADLMALRDQVNSLKYAMNQEAGAVLFNLDPNNRRRWENNVDMRFNTPEGMIADLYGSKRWVTDSAGQVERDPEKRHDLVIDNLIRGQQTRARYDKLRQLKSELDVKLQPFQDIGTPWELKEQAYREYYEAVADVEAAPEYGGADRIWLVGWKPKRLVYQDIRNLMWRTTEQAKPPFIEGEDYGEYLQQIEDWTQSLDKMALLGGIAFWNKFSEIEWMDPEMNSIEDLTDRLVEEFTPEGYRQWQLDGDTPLDAMTRMWQENYWQKYYDKIGDAEGLDFPIREQEFFNEMAAENGETIPMRGPVGPSQETLFRWVQEGYQPGRFTEAQLIEALGDNEILTANDRQLLQREAEIGPELAGLEERWWQGYNKIPPGQSDELIQEYLRLGGVHGESVLDIWRTTTGADAFRNEEEFKESLETLEQAIKNLNWPEPSLDELRQRRGARELNNQFRGYIEENLGEGFWSLQSYFFYLKGGEKDVYKEENPGFEDDLDFYNEARDSMAEQYPLWAAYYTDGGVALGGDRALAGKRGSESIGSGFGGVGGTGGSRLRGLPDPITPPGMRSGATSEDVLRGRVGRGGTTAGFKWPRHLREILGGEALNDLERSASNGVLFANIPDSLKNYIDKLDANDAERNIRKDTEESYNAVRRLGRSGRVEDNILLHTRGDR